LNNLQSQYQQHQLGDTSYLKRVDSIAPLLVHEDSLPQWLELSRQVAFNEDSALGKYRATYFAVMSLWALNKGKFGSAIYYSERNNEERVKDGLFDKGGIPHSAALAITLYYNNRDYSKVCSQFDSVKNILISMPSGIDSGKVSPDQAFVSTMLLNADVYAAYKQKDTIRANEGIAISERILLAIDRQPEKFKLYSIVHHFVYHTLLYTKEKYLNHFDSAQTELKKAVAEVQMTGFPVNYRGSYEEELYSDAFDFYFDLHKIDSATAYYNRVKALHEGVSYSDLDQGFLPQSEAKLEAAKGDYKYAYNKVQKLFDMADSTSYAIVADRDNNLYALTEAEDTHIELINSETREHKARMHYLILYMVLMGMLVMGGSGFWGYRAKQSERLSRLQLGLARNFHDDVGPMLLYANILAKKEAAANPTPGMEELKLQLASLMESVRSISHDLKSDKLNTVNSIYAYTVKLLERIKEPTQIDFNASMDGSNKVLSQMQFDHLRKIMNELISNSIKHSNCTLILFHVRVAESVLTLEYSDNGKGVPQDTPISGIGIQNMQERIEAIRGKYRFYSAVPSGYGITIDIPI
jgi:signal transduction histidine kinase